MVLSFWNQYQSFLTHYAQRLTAGGGVDLEDDSSLGPLFALLCVSEL
jgi:hypothetical protein